MYLPSILSFTAAGLLTALALIHIGKGKRRPQKTFFVISAFALAVAETALGLLLMSQDPERALLCFRILLACSILFPAAGLPFFLVFYRKDDKAVISKRLPGIITLAALLIVVALVLPAQLVVSKIHFTLDGPFWGMTFSGYGKLVAGYLLITNVFFLLLFENTYRSATIPGKVTLKYPLLGILAASFINFIVISRILAISTLDKTFLATQSCGIIIFCVSFLYAALRYSLFDVKVYIGREIVSSVLTLVVSGIYILSLALASYFAMVLGMPYDRLTIFVLAIFAVFSLLAVLVSGKARRRFRQFINENFYFDSYDYRKEWKHYARLMSSSSTIDDFLSNVISSLCETMLVRRGLIWVDAKGGKADSYGFTVDMVDKDLIRELSSSMTKGPVITFKKPEKDWGWIRAVAFLGHGDEFQGFIALGQKDMGASYTEEDRDFLATIADQATLTLEKLLVDERILEAQQIESFDRFSSFVIHDLKNTVGMLSLTAENARENINDADFQRDAIATIKRSIEKMQGLINSLNAHKSPSTISKMETNITSLLEQSINSLKKVADSKNVTLEFTGENEVKTGVDPAAIRRVIENLVLNAIEATPAGGKIEVRVEPDGTKQV
ncbi:MAG: hypothetical protein KAX38_08300, partial [Candidatus Krumholzibacteria bacterium]|nr:hypothetical protein [Candidatus Krumholzibacteria bacterium]